MGRYNRGMGIVDFHTHAFPDGLAGRAIAALEASSGDWKAVLDGRVASLLTSMDLAGIEQSVVCPIATGPHQFPGILSWCQAVRSPRIVPLGSVHPASEDAIGQIDQIVSAGLVGIKLHPMYQDFTVDEPRMDALYEAIADRGLLLVLHCGQDIAYPGLDIAAPRRIAAVAQRHPTLRLVATHLGGWRMWEEVRRCLLGKPVLMETSFAVREMAPPEAAELIRAHGVSRVLFGTDSPWAGQADELALLRRLPLSSAEQRAILEDNPRRVLAGG